MSSIAITAEIVARHGLTAEEFERIKSILGREPNLLELGIFSVMWSEHCSYKSSRRFLKGLPTSGPKVLQGPGENAGAVDIGEGLAAVFKMESHNHPSYIEPYQGAATGVGGILRDIFTMGARPVALLDSLRFGSPEHPKTAWLLEGVVAGIGGYGNCIGVPTVGGETSFDESFNGNCLVNVFCLGICRADRIFRGRAEGIGNPVIYVGAKTGRDGIHGATMASAQFDDQTEHKRPTVQVGDPFTEKLLLEACLELFKSDVVVGIQDMGAAGLTSSTFEMASRAGSGIDLDLDRVPRREEGMTPYELMLSESQERMLLVAKKGREQEVLDLFAKWDLDAAVVGAVTDTERVRILERGVLVGDLPTRPLADEAPLYDRPRARPAHLEELWAFDPSTLGCPVDPDEALVEMLSDPSLGSKRWIWRQYDHMVRLGTILGPGAGDAAVVRVEGGTLGLAMSVDCNSRFCQLDPYQGARLAVAESARNVSCAGGEPLGLTDCLNFGNPEKPEIMWQLVEAIRGLSEACTALGVPVVSGNVSLYNDTDGVSVFPTPSVGVVGLVPDVQRAVGMGFRAAGRKIGLLGRLTGELGGSHYLKVFFDKTEGRPPQLDLELEKAVQRGVREMVREGLVESAHDCAEGGLGVALAECCVLAQPSPLGAVVKLDSSLRPEALLFGEEPSRVLVSFDPNRQSEVEEAARRAGAPFAILGITGGQRLKVEGIADVQVAELAASHSEAIRTLLDQRLEARPPDRETGVP